jgi:hypothetical protein
MFNKTRSHIFEEAAVKLQGKVLFTFSDGSNDIHSNLIANMGVPESEMPTLRGIAFVDKKPLFLLD